MHAVIQTLGSPPIGPVCLLYIVHVSQSIITKGLLGKRNVHRGNAGGTWTLRRFHLHMFYCASSTKNCISDCDPMAYFSHWSLSCIHSILHKKAEVIDVVYGNIVKVFPNLTTATINTLYFTIRWKLKLKIKYFWWNTSFCEAIHVPGQSAEYELFSKDCDWWKQAKICQNYLFYYLCTFRNYTVTDWQHPGMV